MSTGRATSEKKKEVENEIYKVAERAIACRTLDDDETETKDE